ncbi:MAG: hypothetical protein RIQ79_2427 [Verrucomicrobiota bacterium]|jgi:lipopolysaccharide export system permease protein
MQHTRMPLLDRYVLREWLGILGLVLAATLGLLVMHALYEDLEDLLALGANASEVLAYSLVKIPGFVATLLPLCLLVSVLYALGKLHHGSEITAMRAAGLGLFRITRSVWVAGVFFCGVVWFLNATVVPWSFEESRRIWEVLQVRQELQGKAPDRVGSRVAVTFDNTAQGRLWFINRYSQFTKRAYGVSVSELDSQRREVTRWLAREAWQDLKKGGWVLRDGREVQFDPVSGEVVRTEVFRELAMNDFNEDAGLMQIYDAKPDSLSLFELGRVVEHYRASGSPKTQVYALRYASILAECLMPLVIIAFAVPFAVAGVRVNPAVGVSKALGLFVVYFVALRLGMVFGGRGYVTPALAALLPHLALLGAGGVAWVRAR